MSVKVEMYPQGERLDGLFDFTILAGIPAGDQCSQLVAATLVLSTPIC